MQRGLGLFSFSRACLCSSSSAGSGSSKDGEAPATPPVQGLQQVMGVKEALLEKEVVFQPMANGLLYRKLLKTFIKKFDDDHDTIIKAWKQTKFEFYTYSRAHRPDLSEDDAAALNVRGQQIMHAVQGGVVPVYRKDSDGETFCKYDNDTLKASRYQIDPVSPEEFLRRHHDRLSVAERTELQGRLQAAGRWEGSEEFSRADISRMKVRRKRLSKVSCLEDDGPALNSDERIAAAAEDAGSATTTAERVSEPVSIAYRLRPDTSPA